MQIALSVANVALFAPAGAPPASGASFAFIAASPVVGTTTQATLTIAKPTGLTTNDLIVAPLVHNSSYTVTGVPTGWTLAHELLYSGAFIHLYWKLCEASEPANWTWTISSSATPNLTGLALGFSGAATVAVDGTPTSASSTATQIVLPSITTTQPNDLLIAIAGQGGGRAYAPPASMTERADATVGNASIFAASEILAAAGATGTRTITGSSLASPGVLVAFKG